MRSLTRQLLLPLSGCLVCAHVAHTQIAQGPATGSVPSGVHVVMSAMPSAHLLAIAPEGENENEENRIDPPTEHLSTLPPALAPEGANTQFDSSGIYLGTRIPPIFSVDRAGPSYRDLDPPDPQIAAGPRHLMICVNAVIRICDKQGTTLKDIRADDWHAHVLANPHSFDPIVQYDHFAGRWLMLWVHAGSDTLTSFFLLSVSDTDDPLGGWSIWALPGDVNGSTPTHDYPDHEGMGFDSTTIVISSNQYDYASQSVFRQAKLRVIAKSQLYGALAGSVQWTDFWSLQDPYTLRAFNIRPAVHFGQAPAFYLAEMPNSDTATYAVIYRITGAPASPIISAQAIPVTTWLKSPRAEQPPDGATFDSDMSWLHSPIVAMDSSLWIAHTIASGNLHRYTSIRYLRINQFTNSVLEDVAFGADGYWYYYPTIMADVDKNIAMAFSRSSLTEYPAAYMTWRLSNDPPGLRPSVLLQPGQLPHASPGSPFVRWGDYMGVARDPSDGHNLWLLSEYATPPEKAWGTWIAGTRLIPYSGPKIFAGADSLDFGNLAIGPGDTASVRIANFGASALTVTGASCTLSAFHVTTPPSLPISLQTYDSLALRIAFTPSSPGVLRDTLVIASNDPSAPVVKITLKARVFVARAAGPDIIYSASAGTVSGNLFRLDTLSHAASPFGPLGVPELQSLTIRLRDNAIFGIAPGATGTRLYWVDALSGACYDIGALSRSNVAAIAWAPFDTLYAVTTTGQLCRVNPANGHLDTIGVARPITYGALAFDRATKKLWASASQPFANDTLYTINTATGAATVVGTTGFRIRPSALTVSPAGGLFGLVEDVLVSMDKFTATGRAISAFGVDNLRSIAILSGPDAVKEYSNELPSVFSLDQNFPNPFNPATTIRYSVPSAGMVSLTVIDVLGRVVSVPVNEWKSPGEYQVRFSGGGLASGVYFYRMKSGSFAATRKMLLVR